MYYKIKCLGIETEIRWDEKLHPDQSQPTEKQAKNYIRNVFCGGFLPPEPQERMEFYRELETAPVTISYAGSDDKNTGLYRLLHAVPETRALYKKMIIAYENGNKKLRISRRTGMVIFAEDVMFPRWWPDGEWASRESMVLSADPIEAQKQLQFVGVI